MVLETEGLEESGQIGESSIHLLLLSSILVGLSSQGAVKFGEELQTTTGNCFQGATCRWLSVGSGKHSVGK